MHCAGKIPFKTGFIIDRNQNNGKFVTSNCLQIDQNQNRGENLTKLTHDRNQTMYWTGVTILKGGSVIIWIVHVVRSMVPPYINQSQLRSQNIWKFWNNLWTAAVARKENMEHWMFDWEFRHKWAETSWRPVLLLYQTRLIVQSSKKRCIQL